MSKKYIDKNVYDAAKERIRWAIESHDDFFVSFSGGKDSGVLFNLVKEVATEINRLPVKVVFSDLEVVFQETIRYTKSIMDRPDVDPYWMCLEEVEDNASSIYQRYYHYWGDKEKEKWIRPMPNMNYVINQYNIPEGLKKYYVKSNVDDWSIFYFGEYLCDKYNNKSIINFIGMRTDEAFGRYMNVVSMKNRDKENIFTYKYKNDFIKRTTVCLPIYDWAVQDIWSYYSKNSLDYNRVYDSMYKLGIPLDQQRTCFAFGETQKKTLWQWAIIEPETWDKMVDRVLGANYGKMYNHTNISSRKVIKPESITWKDYVNILLDSLPEEARDIFLEKFKIVFHYHHLYYFEKEGIPKEIYIQDSKKDVIVKMKETGLSRKYFISYESLAGAIIRRDFVFKKYGFGYSQKMQDKINRLYDKYKEI
jgi:predicted phosphoadenosine phosphosulfate sulfurtransferase